ncbi:hypothetical protein [Rhodoligotrophos defluvii]|uniref:hypothetical protein n=1 Tax=Rhodoligotrophos defluvii TaxID=2561934 RepID=UPI0010C9EC02|nr:hypothetical protein [Rhodoligotrophos defluvii]
MGWWPFGSSDKDTGSNTSVDGQQNDAINTINDVLAHDKQVIDEYGNQIQQVHDELHQKTDDISTVLLDDRQRLANLETVVNYIIKHGLLDGHHSRLPTTADAPPGETSHDHLLSHSDSYHV